MKTIKLIQLIFALFLVSIYIVILLGAIKATIELFAKGVYVVRTLILIFLLWMLL